MTTKTKPYQHEDQDQVEDTDITMIYLFYNESELKKLDTLYNFPE